MYKVLQQIEGTKTVNTRQINNYLFNFDNIIDRSQPVTDYSCSCVVDP